MTPSDVAAHSGISQAAVTHHLNALEKAGYISRKSSPDDRRITHIQLTKSGQKIASHREEDFLGLIEYLGERDVKKLISLLGKISSYIEERKDRNS